MARRALLAGLLCLTAVSSTHVHRPSPHLPVSNMPAAPASAGSTHPLTVELSAGSANSSVACTIRNSNPQHTITFLTWDTPFDPSAVNAGVVTLKDAETGADIPSPGMKMNRQLPPPREALQEIAAKSSAMRELKLASPWIPTDGKKYVVGVQGSWRAAWQKPAAQITDEELAGVKGDQALQGSFHGEGVEMELD